MSLDWNDLQFCLAIAREGTMAAAARRLGVDHATIVRRLDRLERDLGTKVFTRRRNGCEITEAGRRVTAMAEAVEREVRAGAAEIAGGGAHLSGSLRMGAPDGFGACFLAPNLGLLADRYPDLQIELVATARLFSLSKREADIAISLAMPQEGRIIGRRLVDYRLFLYASEAYLARTPPIASAADLARHRLIGYIGELLFTPELDYLPQIAPGLSAQIRSANLLAQLQAAIAGVGIAVLPRFLAAQHPGLKPVLSADIGITRSFYLLMHADGKDLPQVRAVADFLYDLVERHRNVFLDPP